MSAQLQPGGCVRVCSRFCALLFALSITPSWLLAAPADFDPNFMPTFGYTSARVEDGKAVYSQAMAIQPDGKIVVGASCQINASTRATAFCVARFLSSGGLDQSFNPNGSPGAGTLLHRIGNIDPTVSRAGGDAIASTRLQTDGKILAAGNCQRYTGPSGESVNDFCAARYLPDGTLDGSFNTTGTLTTRWEISAGNYTTEVFSSAIQSDGKVVIAGTCSPPSNLKSVSLCLARYQANGALDTQSFNAGASASGDRGLVLTSLTDPGFIPDSFTSMAIQTDGKIIVAGRCSSTAGGVLYFDFCLIRYLPDGQLDRAGFGGPPVRGIATPAGMMRVSIEQQSFLNSMHLNANGKIVLVGTCRTDATFQRICVSQHNADGSLNQVFANSGTVIQSLLIPTHPTQSRIAFTTSALQSDGKLIVAANCSGTSSGASPTNVIFRECLLRLHLDGSLDTGFTKAGQAVKDGRVFGLLPDNYSLLQRDISVRPEGGVVLLGSCYNTQLSRDEICVAQLQGGPTEGKACSGDIDGDNQISSAVDSVILARIALGFTGASVTEGIAFAPHATRKTWPLIRDYLSNHCGMRTSL